MQREPKPEGMGSETQGRQEQEEASQSGQWRAFWAVLSNSVQEQRQEAVARSTRMFE